jgi:Zn-dependent protease
LPVSPQTSIWPQLDQSILAGYAATEQQEYEQACACYQTAIDTANEAAQASPIERNGKNGGGKKKVQSAIAHAQARGALYVTSFYPRPLGRALPEQITTKETEMATALRALGIRQQKLDDFVSASATFERTGELFTNTLGPFNGHSAWCFYCAGLLGDQSNQRREYLYRRALEIYEHLEALGTPQTGNITDCLAALAYCLAEQGRQEDAYATINRSIDGIEKFGPSKSEIPAFMQLTLAKLVNGGVLHKRLNVVCLATGRKLSPMAGLPNKTKQVLSLAITIAFFWFLLGSIGTASAFLILLLIHEMGHFLAARQVGVEVTPPVFTPMGAVIAMLSQPASAKDEAYFAIAGPALGTVGAFIALFLSMQFGITELGLAAKFAFALNLFNLIPLAPMDGGRICMAISRKMWIVGAALYGLLVCAIFYYTFVPVVGGLQPTQLIATFPLKLFVLYWVARGAWVDYKDRAKMALMTPQYFKIPLHVRLAYTVAYFGLGAILVCALSYATDLPPSVTPGT